MNLFEVVPQAFFKPLVSKYKHLYFDCIQLLYSSYAITVIEAFEKIRKMKTEFQSLISTIHTLLMREENYKKPYEYILKNVFENTHERILNLVFV